MSDRMVEPIPKQGRKPSRQKQRREQFIAEQRKIRRVIELRNHGRCEMPSCPRLGSEMHHKAGRKVPGANHPSRLMWLCKVHHERIHANPEWSYELGYLIRPSTILEAVPDERG